MAAIDVIVHGLVCINCSDFSKEEPIFKYSGLKYEESISESSLEKEDLSVGYRLSKEGEQ